MWPLAGVFRDIAAQACRTRKHSFTDFMINRGLEGVLEQANNSQWPATEIAVQVLLQCCVENGQFNNFQVGVLAVMMFLNDRLGQQPQAIIDLGSILKSGPTEVALRGWATSHYP